jgi:hypothetical protein
MDFNFQLITKLSYLLHRDTALPGQLAGGGTANAAVLSRFLQFPFQFPVFHNAIPFPKIKGA